jgi:hypothetical protein
MATAMFAETLDNLQHSMRLIPESRCCTLNSGRENPGTRTVSVDFQYRAKFSRKPFSSFGDETCRQTPRPPHYAFALCASYAL